MRAALPLAWLSFCALVTVPARAAATIFRPLPDLPGGATESRAWGISRDGSTIVGAGSDAAGQAAVRWTTRGIEAIEPDAFGNRPYTALAASSDGRIVTGLVGPGTRAYFWNSAAQPAARTRALPTFAGAAIQSSRASDVDETGRFIVGSAHAIDSSPTNPRVQAVYWDIASPTPAIHGLGYVSTPALPLSSAAGISGDGGTIVGDGRGPSSIVPFVARRDSAAITALQLAFTATGDGITSTTRDGTMLVGNLGRRAFRWDGQLGMLDLPGAGWYSSAAAASDNGSVIVGSAQPADLSRASAVLWDRAGRVRRLEDLLADDHGIDLEGWSLVAATAVSGDGLTLAGYGLNPLGQTQAFVVQVPAPSAMALIVLCLAARRRGGARIEQS